MLASTLLLLTTSAAATSSSSSSSWEDVVLARGTHSGAPLSPIDLRVTPAHAARGDGQVRLTVVTNLTAPHPSPTFFDYNEPFKYRWTDKYLQSTLKPARPDGSPTTFEIDGLTFQVTVPAKGSPSVGLIIADPCFHGAAAGCSYSSKFQTFARTTSLINAAVPKLDYWMILGDNFYDRAGHLTQTWFDQRSLDVKSTLFATVAGNHDYWGFGSGILALASDQFGNGHAQYYGMDTVASVRLSNTTQPPGDFIDFSVDPDAKETKHQLPPLENFFTWFSVGNVGFVLYSGGYDYTDTKRESELNTFFFLFVVSFSVPLLNLFFSLSLLRPPRRRQLTLSRHALG
jgi:hypothetical protein